MPWTTEQDLLNWFEYHAPQGGQVEKYRDIRAAGLRFAQSILRLTPSSADQSAALRAVREATMWANASIACAPQGGGGDASAER